MPETPLSQGHLGTLHAIHRLGRVPSRKSEIAPLVKRGLVEAAGPRGQFGMTYYRATAEGKALARNVNLSGGKFSLPETAGALQESPIASPSAEVPEGHMRMANGTVRKIARNA